MILLPAQRQIARYETAFKSFYHMRIYPNLSTRPSNIPLHPGFPYLDRDFKIASRWIPASQSDTYTPKAIEQKKAERAGGANNTNSEEGLFGEC